MHKTTGGEIAESDRAETESKRILIVAPQPFFSERGTPIAILHVIHALRELSYEVDVLTYPIGRGSRPAGRAYFSMSNPFRVRHVDIGFSLRKLVFGHHPGRINCFDFSGVKSIIVFTLLKKRLFLR